MTKKVGTREVSKKPIFTAGISQERNNAQLQALSVGNRCGGFSLYDTNTPNHFKIINNNDELFIFFF